MRGRRRPDDLFRNQQVCVVLRTRLKRSTWSDRVRISGKIFRERKRQVTYRKVGPRILVNTLPEYVEQMTCYNGAQKSVPFERKSPSPFTNDFNAVTRFIKGKFYRVGAKSTFTLLRIRQIIVDNDVDSHLTCPKRKCVLCTITVYNVRTKNSLVSI